MKNVRRNKRTACVDCSDFYEQLLQTLLPAVAADFKIVRADIDDIPVYLAVDSAADMVFRCNVLPLWTDCKLICK